jgi:hypothetical protein
MEELVKNWYEAKEELVKLENKIKDYKLQAQVYMKQNKEWKGKDYTLEIKEMKRRVTSRDDFPDDMMWKAYSHETSFDCYYIYKAGEKRRSRSPGKRSKSPKK